MQKLLNLSRLSTDELRICQTKSIFFGEQTQRDDIVLFEVDKKTLNDINTSHE